MNNTKLATAWTDEIPEIAFDEIRWPEERPEVSKEVKAGIERICSKAQVKADDAAEDGGLFAQRFNDLQPEEFELPEVSIDCLAYVGSKILFSGESKSRKTWAMLYLLLCMQAGAKFWGFQTHKTPTLIVDLELQRPVLLQRIKWIAEKAGIPLTDNLFLKSLRGQRVNFEKQKKALVSFCLKHGIKAIGIDPVYRIKTGEENSNDDIANFMLLVESVAHEAGAVVVLTHHFAKGNSAAKKSIDRMSGAGVWARDPDVLLAMTEQKDSDAYAPTFVIEPTVRDFPPVESFAIRWDAPLWIRDDSASCLLKGAGRPEKDENWIKKIPVGKERAMRYDQLGIDLSKPTLERKIKGRDDVHTVKKANSAGRQENHYYRYDRTSLITSDKIQNNSDRGELQTA